MNKVFEALSRIEDCLYEDPYADRNDVSYENDIVTIKQALIQVKQYDVLKKFSTQETVYSIYGTHTNEIVLVDFELERIHITIDRCINDTFTFYISDYKKTWWLKEDRSE